MGTRGTGAANAFSQAVNAELRALMGRRSFTQTRLAELTGVSQSNISKIIYRDEAPLNTNQLDAIANALGDQPSEILRRAERAIANQYDLAALEEETRPDARDEDYF